MSLKSKDPAIMAGLQTPLSKLGDLPCEVFLGCLALVPARSRERLLRSWSESLSGGPYSGPGLSA